MFEGIQQGISEALRRLRGRGRLTEANIREGMVEVRRALLEADVHLDVVTRFITAVTERAVGQDVIRSIDPSQQIVKIVHDELVALMGPVDHEIPFRRHEPTFLMLVGLQGSGKTTTCGKLAHLLRAQGRKPLLVAADLQRPAAIDQLEVIGQQIEVPVYCDRSHQDPVRVCQDAIPVAASRGADTIILDTAGRLHIDAPLMDQLREIDRRIHPQQIYLVVDATVGQDAVTSAKAFHSALELDGVILTKLDGDARGGATLSVKSVTGVPIRFVGVGEKMDRLEPFHPERMAGRILGMGDVVSLVERAQQVVDEEEARRQQERMARGEFTLEDFRKALVQMERMGSLRDFLDKIPGINRMLPDTNVDDGELMSLRGMIDSMTPSERRHPDRIDMSRRRRIAAGSGCEPSDINHLLKQFTKMRPYMKQMAAMGMKDRVRALSSLGNAGMLDPGAQVPKLRNPAPTQIDSEERRRQRKLERQRKKQNRRR